MVERIFISYRRDDSAGHAGRVFDRLRADFKDSVLFMDVDAIPLGSNFVRVLQEEVARCSVLLAIIGPRWLDAKDEDGERRLDNANDFVRVEIAAALARDIPVIPILLDGARIPKASLLPPDLAELSQRNGLDVRHASFHGDMDKLVRGLRGVAVQKVETQPVPAAAPVPQPKPTVADLDLPLLPDGTIGIMEEIEMPIVPGLLRWKPVLPPNATVDDVIGHIRSFRQPPVPTVDEVIEAKGKWVNELNIDARAAVSPEVFSHYFIRVHRSASDIELAAAGSIVSGHKWDRSDNPFWMPIHGHFRSEHPHCSWLGFLTYLGPTWRPEYAALSDAVFKKLGGKPLAHFVKHP